LANFTLLVGQISSAQIVDEINDEFFAKRCVPAIFYLAHKGW